MPRQALSPRRGHRVSNTHPLATSRDHCKQGTSLEGDASSPRGSTSSPSLRLIVQRSVAAPKSGRAVQTQGPLDPARRQPGPSVLPSTLAHARLTRLPALWPRLRQSPPASTRRVRRLRVRPHARQRAPPAQSPPVAGSVPPAMPCALLYWPVGVSSAPTTWCSPRRRPDRPVTRCARRRRSLNQSRRGARRASGDGRAGERVATSLATGGQVALLVAAHVAEASILDRVLEREHQELGRATRRQADVDDDAA